MTIRSNPPGAMFYVDDYEIGITPISTSFIYYGNGESGWSKTDMKR